MMKHLSVSYLLYLALTFMSVACTTTPTGEVSIPDDPTPNLPVNADPIEIDASWSQQAREVLLHALSLTGSPYQFGGHSPETGFDCSGFVRYVYLQATSLTLPHNARAMSHLGKAIPRPELKPGDLVFFDTLKSAFSHVGIYLGNNKFIHAPGSGGNVRVESMQNSYWLKRFNGAQRIEKSDQSR